MRTFGTAAALCQVIALLPVAPKSRLMNCRQERNPTWGTCAGLILLAESANRTKKGGQELIGGVDVRVNRNYFGRQVESFEAELNLPFLVNSGKKIPDCSSASFKGVFIRAPIVEKVLLPMQGVQVDEEARIDTVVAPSQIPADTKAAKAVATEVEVLATLPGRTKVVRHHLPSTASGEGDIVAVRQGNVFGTSFHPELTTDPRIHIWWLRSVISLVRR